MWKQHNQNYKNIVPQAGSFKKDNLESALNVRDSWISYSSMVDYGKSLPYCALTKEPKAHVYL